MGEQFCQTVRLLHERYSGYVSTVSPLLFRTLAKLSRVNGPGTVCLLKLIKLINFFTISAFVLLFEEEKLKLISHSACCASKNDEYFDF